MASDVKVTLDLDKGKFDAALKGAEKGVNSFAGNALKAFAPLATAAGLGALASAAVDLGSKVSDLAFQLNIGTTELQAMQAAARKAGVDQTILQESLRNVQVRTQQAVDGNAELGRAFQRLGIDVEVFKNLAPERQMEVLAVAQSKATDQTAAYNDVAKILGESAGPKMQEVLQRLATEGFDAVAEAAISSGQVLSEETIAKLDKASDEFEKLQVVAQVFAGELLARLAPALQIVITTMGTYGDVVGGIINIMLTLGEAVAGFITSALSPLGQAFVAVGKAGEAMGAALSGQFDKAKQLATDAGEAFLEIGDVIANVPTRFAQTFDKAASDVSRITGGMRDDVIDGATEIGQKWQEVFEGLKVPVKEVTAEVEAMMEAAAPGPEVLAERAQAATAEAAESSMPAFPTRNVSSQQFSGNVRTQDAPEIDFSQPARDPRTGRMLNPRSLLDRNMLRDSGIPYTTNATGSQAFAAPRQNGGGLGPQQDAEEMRKQEGYIEKISKAVGEINDVAKALKLAITSSQSNT